MLTALYVTCLVDQVWPDVGLCSALLLRHSLGLEAESRAVEAAVNAAISQGVLPGDVAPAGAKPATTAEAGAAVRAALAA